MCVMLPHEEKKKIEITLLLDKHEGKISNELLKELFEHFVMSNSELCYKARAIEVMVTDNDD